MTGQPAPAGDVPFFSSTGANSTLGKLGLKLTSPDWCGRRRSHRGRRRSRSRCCPFPVRTRRPKFSALRARNLARISTVSPWPAGWSAWLSPPQPGGLQLVAALSQFLQLTNRCRLQPHVISDGLQAQVPGTLIALRQGSVGMLPAYCQLFIQAIMIRRFFGTLLKVTPA